MCTRKISNETTKINKPEKLLVTDLKAKKIKLSIKTSWNKQIMVLMCLIKLRSTEQSIQVGNTKSGKVFRLALLFIEMSSKELDIPAVSCKRFLSWKTVKTHWLTTEMSFFLSRFKNVVVRFMSSIAIATRIESLLICLSPWRVSRFLMLALREYMWCFYV